MPVEEGLAFDDQSLSSNRASGKFLEANVAMSAAYLASLRRAMLAASGFHLLLAWACQRVQRRQTFQ